jgi:hypothetical protein
MNDPNVSTLEKAKQFGADAYNIVLPSAGGVIGAGAGAGLASVPLAIGGGVVGAGAAKALDAGLGLESGQTDAFRKYATPPPAAAPAPAPTAAPAQQKTVEQNTAQNLAPFGAQAQVRAVDNAITERQQNGVGTINPVSVDPNDPSFKGKMAQAGYENMLKNQEMSKQQAWRASPLGSLAGALGSSASLRIGQAGENRVRKEAVQDTELGIKAANANNSAANTKRGMDSDAEKVGGDHLKRATTIFTDPKKGPEYNQAVEAGAIGMLAGAGLSPGKATEAQREAAIHHSSIAQKIHEANKSNWLSPSSKGVPRNRDSIAPSSLKDGIYETPSGPVKAKDLTGEELAQMDALLADAKKNQKASLQDGRK